jgi:hypothetical protein
MIIGQLIIVQSQENYIMVKKGQSYGSARLVGDAVRADAATLNFSYKELCAKYNLCPSTIIKILAGDICNSNHVGAINMRTKRTARKIALCRLLKRLAIHHKTIADVLGFHWSMYFYLMRKEIEGPPPLLELEITLTKPIRSIDQKIVFIGRYTLKTMDIEDECILDNGAGKISIVNISSLAGNVEVQPTGGQDDE